MSLFYNAFFIKSKDPTVGFKEKFYRIDYMPESDWVVCNFGEGFPTGLFEPVYYFTKEISKKYGETIFICVAERDNQLEYEHSNNGIILRKLTLISDGNQSTWACDEGEAEDWESSIVFSETTFKQAIDVMEYEDLPKDEFEKKKIELQSIWKQRKYIIGDRWPLVDAAIGIAIQNYFKIKMPSSIRQK